MSPPLEQDWADLVRHWQGQHADIDKEIAFDEQDMLLRLRHQRVLKILLTAAEVAGLAVVLGIASWMSRLWLSEPGASPVLILLLLLPACIVLWQRWRQRVSPAARALEGIESAIEREERLLESARLSHVMSLLALAAMIMMVLVQLYHHTLVIRFASVLSFALMYLYVFGLQIALLLWTRRLRRRRAQLEAVRMALHPAE